MSQQSSDVKPAIPSAKGVDDIFNELSKDDDSETLDLTRPLKKSADSDEKPGKTEDEAISDEDDKREDEEDDKEEDEEVEDIEEQLKGLDDTKLELTTPVRRKDILKKYPTLFKDFPYLEKAYYREQQFTEILPTIEDAKEAAESHKVLQRYSEDMIEKGNVSNVLKMIKDNNTETYAEVVDNYLEHLNKVDPSAFLHVQSTFIKNIIVGMVEEAKASKDDDLRTAALLLNRWAFGSSQFVPPAKMSKNESKGDNSIDQREKEFAQRQFDSAVSDINTRVNNAIKGAIDNNIDPTSIMTDYIKRNASKDALDKITRLIEKDTRFQAIVDKLWDKAAKDGLSTESVNEIRKAFLSKAKSLLAPVCKSARNEALRGMGKKPLSDDEEEKVQRRERVGNQDNRQPERRLSSDRQKAKLDSVKGKSTYEALQALMGD